MKQSFKLLKVDANVTWNMRCDVKYKFSANKIQATFTHNTQHKAHTLFHLDYVVILLHYNR